MGFSPPSGLPHYMGPDVCGEFFGIQKAKQNAAEFHFFARDIKLKRKTLTILGPNICEEFPGIHTMSW